MELKWAAIRQVLSPVEQQMDLAMQLKKQLDVAQDLKRRLNEELERCRELERFRLAALSTAAAEPAAEE
jgi:DNA-directed RNA polymerase subunit L